MAASKKMAAGDSAGVKETDVYADVANESQVGSFGAANDDGDPLPAANDDGIRVESVRGQYLDEYSYEEAIQRMKAHVALSEDVRKLGRGRWIVPQGYEHMTRRGSDGRPAFRFIRLGCMANTRARAAILQGKFVLEQMGWKEAPRGTRNTLFYGDGDAGVYLCLPEVAGKLLDEHEKKSRRALRERRFSRGVNRLPEDMKLRHDMRVEQLDIQQGKMSAEDFNKMR